MSDYDEKSYALAVHFLLDVMQATDPRYEKAADELARRIQAAVEEWFSTDCPPLTEQEAS